MNRFDDRHDAGRRLGEALGAYAGRGDVVVLALPRGGVPVGYEVARALDAPLEPFLVRKLGVPGHEELAMGAIASGGIRVLNRDIVDALRIPQRAIDEAAAREGLELERRERLYRGDRPAVPIEGRVAILVDDGLATGSSMRAAIGAVRASAPARVVVAVPVAAEETCAALRADVDEVVCVETPEPFHAVGLWYRNFDQTSDDEVRELLGAAHPVLASRP
jgi:putative phosphoribosyl transferase